jgi:hypothetical protein
MDLRIGLVRTGQIWLRRGPVEGTCEHGRELCDFMHFWEVPELLYNWRPIEQGSVTLLGVITRLASAKGTSLEWRVAQPTTETRGRHGSNF